MLLRNAIVKLAVSAILVLAAANAYAGFDSVLAKGFKPNIAYQVNEFDAVNTLSGDLMLNVPIGPTYKTNGTLQYSFGIHYTADFWNYNSFYGINNPSPEPTHITIIDGDGGWDAYSFTVIDWSGGPAGSSDGNFIGAEAVPGGTVGVGWNVSTEKFAAFPVGEFVRGGLYTDATGATHTFMANLHAITNCGSTPCNNVVAYTHDGSYLRMRLVNNDPLIREIDLPDGTVKHFHCVANCGNNALTPEWNLEWTADPFGNVLLIERTDGNGTPAPSRPNPGQWIFNYIEGTLPDGETRSNPYYQGTPSERAALKIVRQHRLVYSVEDPNGKYKEHPWLLGVRLVRAELAGPQGDRSMVFVFNYEQRSILRAMVRPYIQQPSALLFPYNVDKTINVMMLTSITLPDNSGKWQLDYHPGSAFDGDTLSYTYCMDFTAPTGGCPVNMLYPTSRLAGRVKSARVPTGGGYQYDYEARSLPRRICGVSPRNGGFSGGLLIGVKTRQQLDADGHPIAGAVWRYSGNGYFRAFVDLDHDGWDDSDVNHNGQWDPGIDTMICRAPLEFLSSTLDPKGLLTVDYYNIHLGDMSSDDPEHGGKWFGAPFSPDPDRADTVTRADGSTARRYLTEQLYSVDMSGASPFVTNLADAVRRLFPTYRRQNDAPSDATLLRSHYTLYEASALECDTETNDCQQYNLRPASEHARYNDDPAATNSGERAFVETLNGDFDGLGHFRQKNTYGNLKVVGRPNATLSDWDHRIEYTSFNPAVNYVAGQNPVLPTPYWNLGTYAHTTKLEFGRLSSMRFLFDSKRGYLRASRKLEDFDGAGPTPIPPASAANIIADTGVDDFLAVYHRSGATDGDGMPLVVVREQDFGGDGGHLNGWQVNGDEVVIADTAHRDYTIDTTYRAGSVSKTEYKGCDPNQSFLVSNSSFIENGMGLPLTITDESGLTTNYAYDSMGRFTTVTPPGNLTAQTYGYDFKTGPAGANRLTVARAGGATLTFEYDFLGRLLHESHAMPGGATSTTTYTYTPTGKIDTQILPMGSPGTIRYTYDVFDRETHVVGADNKTVDTIYNSIRGSVRTTNGIAADAGISAEAQLSKSFDSLGRLWSASDDQTHAVYEFDALSDIIHVILNAAGASNPKQHRRFDYDGRGVLVTSEPAELRDASGSGRQTLLRQSFDSRGHVTAADLIWADPANQGPSLDSWRVRFDYDSAERLQQVWQPAGSGNRKILKSYKYYDSDDAPGRRAHLKSAVRKNYYSDPSRTGGIPTIDVTTTNSYDACSGAVTSCTGLLTSSATVASIPSASGAAPQSFFSGTVGYGYDPRGEVSRVDYPVFGDGPARTVTYGYDSGFLTSVNEGPMRRATISYSLNGLTSVVQLAANNVRDVITPDGSGIARVGKFDWKWANGSTTSDWYVYDGAGMISAIGPDTFRYDHAARLLRATVGGQPEQYVYDGFGNLTRNGARVNDVDTASNRVKPPFVYDPSGNVVQMPDGRPSFAGSNLTFVFDALNQMTFVDGASLGRAFVYDAGDQRVGIIDYKAAGGRRELWSLRDQSNSVLRDFQRTFAPSGLSQWSWMKDYVYRGSLLCNTISSAGVRDIHVDHLGSVRIVTDGNGQLVAGESSSGTKYWPFGNLVFNRTLDERLAFTGHERDDDGTTAGQADFDYMHARYYSPAAGRFLSIDSNDGKPELPQSWNRFAYVRNHPLTSIDRDGNSDVIYSQRDHELVVFNDEGFPVLEGRAANNVCSNATGTLPTTGVEPGEYTFVDRSAAGGHVGQADTGPYGGAGIFHIDTFTDSGGTSHSDVGIHGGRVGVPDGRGRSGEQHCTEGCIRVEQSTMNQVPGIAANDPLNKLFVTSGSINGTTLLLMRLRALESGHGTPSMMMPSHASPWYQSTANPSAHLLPIP
jgi:RHS repeat-associated protein